jgi:hypothetical protein
VLLTAARYRAGTREKVSGIKRGNVRTNITI